MFNMNYKTELQEALQKIKAPLPIYSSAQTSKLLHETEWISTVTIFDIDFIGEKRRSKKEAEQNAAQFALDYIIEKNLTGPKPKYVLPKHIKTLVLIDLENITPENLPKNENTGYIGFITYNNYTKWGKKIIQLEEMMVIKATECLEKDASDHLMTFYLAYNCALWNISDRPEKIIILTKDHFGQVLKCLINEYFKNILVIVENSTKILI